MPELLGNAQALPKIATPSSPPSGYVSIYAKSDDKVYALSSGGVETDLTATGGGGGGGSSLLAVTAYNPASETTFSTSSATFIDTNAANLVVTFTATSSRVLVRLSAYSSPVSSLGTIWWGLRSGTTNVTDTEQVIATSSVPLQRNTGTMLVSGLTSGTSYTYKWAHHTSASGNIQIICGSNRGPAVMEVFSA